ncbi:MAG: hypothetical protein IPK98_16575 [Chloracidobacterium sp.]|nr:hypothetical protein [Chloracidobacterium sp.]
MIEREQVPMDVVFVGAGPANLAAALHLKAEIKRHDELVEKGFKTGRQIGELEIAIVEKGSFVGAHILSGAVMDPIAIRELMPDFLDQGCPVDSVVTEDAFWYLTPTRGFVAPITPPPLKNKGKVHCFSEQGLRMARRKVRRGGDQYFSGVSRRRNFV